MADEKMQELNQDLLDDDLLADIPMSLLDNSPMIWEEEEQPVADIPEDTFEDDLLAAEELLAEEDFLEDDISIEELLADYPTEPELRKEEKMPTKKKTSKKSKNAKQKSDRSLIVLMAVASFLCIGIIGMLIYWLEVFL